MIHLPTTTVLRTRPELSKFVIESIESFDVKLPPTSRLRRMHDLYHSGIPTIGPDHRDFEVALEGERDMQLLGFAFDQLPRTELSRAFRDCTRKLIKDSVLPQQDRKNSPGRDAAFELYVGAVCTAAGLCPVAWEEPDVTCVWNDVKYGFAAKRVKSEKSLYDRVSGAVDQIRRCGLPGVVVLDAFLAFNPDNRRLAQMPDTIFWSEYHKNVMATWTEYHPKLQKIMSQENVLGMVVHDYQVRQQGGQWSLAGMTMRMPAEAGATSAELSLFDELSTLYTYALPNQDDVSNRKIILP